MLKEAARLYKQGFAIIWLHPKSKRPIESGWTTGERKPWAYLASAYKEGMNVGVRTGTPSKVGGGYLACIDVDIKNPAFAELAEQTLKELLGDRILPEVRSGSGNGSRHLYCWTKTPFKMLTILKMKGAGEICVYSDGRQMVLPPSIHPSGKPYEWGARAVPAEMDFTRFATIASGTPVNINGKQIDWSKAADGIEIKIEPFAFTVDDSVDLDLLPISDKIKEGILHGTDVVDRSNFLLPASIALSSAGLTRDQVLSILSNPQLWISGCAFDHAQTKDRRRAAEWLWKYTVRRVFEERDAKTVFGVVTDEDLGGERLTAAQEARQTEEILADINWTQHLVRTKTGIVLPSMHNIMLILKNEVDEKFIRRDNFAIRDAYSMNTPWGGKAGVSIIDDDMAKIRHWLGQTYSFEPGRNVVEDCLIVSACENSFDPVVDWMDSLPDWDGVSRLDTWLADHFEAQGDPEYLAQVFRKWMTAMVMRIYRPGAKFDWMPIFEGLQGIGKSSFGRLLVTDKYFLDWLPNLGEKDAALGLQGMWAVEMGELSQFRKNELETIKAFLTRTTDKFRPPHGKKLVEYPRRCVFFGTTNRERYLGDDSGNRRFKPVKVGNLNFDQLRKDRDQLFAEAKIWAGKYSELDLELTGQARVFEAKIHQEKMLEDDSNAMLEPMLDFIEKSDDFKGVFDFGKFRILDLFGGGGPLNRWKMDNRNMQFASKMLKRLGAQRRVIRGQSYWKVTQVGGLDRPPLTTKEENFF